MERQRACSSKRVSLLAQRPCGFGSIFVVVFELLTGNLGLLTGNGVGWLVGGPLGKVSVIGVGP